MRRVRAAWEGSPIVCGCDLRPERAANGGFSFNPEGAAIGAVGVGQLTREIATLDDILLAVQQIAVACDTIAEFPLYILELLKFTSFAVFVPRWG